MPASATNTRIRAVEKGSPARDDLDGTIKRRDQARQAAAAARQPLDRGLDQQEHAEQSERNAQAAVAAVDAHEASLVGKSWPPPSLTPKMKESRRNAEDDLAAARRILSTVQSNVAAARGPAELAAAKVAEIEGEIDGAICAVMIEEGQAALARLVETRHRAIEAEGVCRSLALTMASKQWFRGAETISASLYALPRLDATIDTAPYLKLVERLASDADAEV
jgi:hypothetical protein